MPDGWYVADLALAPELSMSMRVVQAAALVASVVSAHQWAQMHLQPAEVHFVGKPRLVRPRPRASRRTVAPQ